MVSTETVRVRDLRETDNHARVDLTEMVREARDRALADLVRMVSSVEDRARVKAEERARVVRTDSVARSRARDLPVMLLL